VELVVEVKELLIMSLHRVLLELEEVEEVQEEVVVLVAVMVDQVYLFS
jgi:hypothetical protein